MKYVLADERLPQSAEDALAKAGYSVIRLPASKALPAPLASHTDMLAFVSEHHVVTSEKYREANAALFDRLEKTLPYKVFIYDSTDHSPSYPNDAIFNALKIGDRLFCKTDTVSREILNLAKSEGWRIIHVNQGYPACVTLPLGNEAAISSDKGMTAAMRAEGIRVYEINNSGAISLPPYEYGFIGGAAGEAEGTVYFIGDIDAHPDASTVKEALEDARYGYVSLPTGTRGLLDLGRLIFC